MSIKLHIEDYCENCPDFEAEVEHNSLVDVYGNRYVCDTDIYCQHRYKCKCLMEHLKNAKMQQEIKDRVTDTYKTSTWHATFDAKTYTTTVKCGACGQEHTYAGDAFSVLKNNCADECPDCKAKMINKYKDGRNE